jgi:hypothetical protein
MRAINSAPPFAPQCAGASFPQLSYHEAERLVIAFAQTSADFRLKRLIFPIGRIFITFFAHLP